MHKIDKVSMDGSWLFKDTVDKQTDQQAELSVEIHPTIQLWTLDLLWNYYAYSGLKDAITFFRGKNHDCTYKRTPTSSSGC